jgi:rubrerythrin
MSFEFNADDIFAMAEQIERNGAEFYRTACIGIADANARTFLDQLSKMEEDHEKTFASIRAGLSQKEKTPTVFDPQDESALYLKALADTKVFFEKQIDVCSMKEVLKAAIEAEKDSIVFYLGMKDIVPDALGKKRIDDIIKEEMGHIRLLSKELVKLTA